MAKTRYLTTQRGRLVFKRFIPRELHPLFMKTALFVYLGDVSQHDAEKMARRLASVADEMFQRAALLTDDQKREVRRAGGFEKWLRLDVHRIAALTHAALTDDRLPFDPEIDVSNPLNAKALQEDIATRAEMRAAVAAEPLLTAISHANVGHTLDELVAVWAQRRGVSKSARNQARVWWQRFAELTGAPTVEKISATHVRAFRDHIEDRIGIDWNGETAASGLQRIKTLLSFAVDIGWIDHNPSEPIRVHAPRLPTAPPSRKGFSPSEVRSILAHLHKLPDPIRWHALLMLRHGARAADLDKLKASDLITVDGILVFVVAGMVKTRQTARRVPLHSSCGGFVDYAKKTSKPLFLAKTFQDHMRPFLDGLKIELRAHAFRHAWIAAARRAGVSEHLITVITGKARPKTDYGEPTLSELRDAIEKVKPEVD